MAKTALMVGGPCHMKRMKLPSWGTGTPPLFQVERMDPMDVNLVGPVKAYDEIKLRTLTYRPRTWFGNEVWVLDGLSDSAALDMLLGSAFNKRRR
jgi:hypothetical protein